LGAKFSILLPAIHFFAAAVVAAFFSHGRPILQFDWCLIFRTVHWLFFLNQTGNGLAPAMMFGGGPSSGNGGGGGGGQVIPQQTTMQMPAGMVPMLLGIPGLSHHHLTGGMTLSGMPGLHPGFAMQAPMVLPAAVAQQLAMSGGGGGSGIGSHSELLSAKPSPAPKFKKAPDAPKVCTGIENVDSSSLVLSAFLRRLEKRRWVDRFDGKREKTDELHRPTFNPWLFVSILLL
jgi:hypothetical protein